MATSSVPKIKPGFLLTHDWSQLRTEKSLCDTTITEKDGQDFKTVIFPINRRSQVESLVNGQFLRQVSGCPLQTIGNIPLECCDDKPLSAVVKVIYQVTHTLSADQDSPLSAEAINSLRQIDNVLGQNNVPTQALELFLQNFGSHFHYGSQNAGKAFSWIVYSEDECDMDILREIANEIFTVCQECATLVPASQEGHWYSVQNIVNSSSLSHEKQSIFKSIKLCVSQCGSLASSINFEEWKSVDVEDQLLRVDGDSTNIVSIWDLIDKSEFQNTQGLKSAVKDTWKCLVSRSSHKDRAILFVPDKPTEVQFPDAYNALQQESILPKNSEKTNFSTMHMNSQPPKDIPQMQEGIKVPVPFKSLTSMQKRVAFFESQQKSPTCTYAIPQKNQDKLKPRDTLRRSASMNIITRTPRNINLQRQRCMPENPDELKLSAIQVTSQQQEIIPQTTQETRVCNAFEQAPLQNQVSPRKLQMVCQPGAHDGYQQDVISETTDEKKPPDVGNTSPQQVAVPVNSKEEQLHPQCVALQSHRDKEFVRSLGMTNYFPYGLSLQKVRTLCIRKCKEEKLTKTDLPWKVLEQIMFMNSECREYIINEFAKTLELNDEKEFRQSIVDEDQDTEGVPHPMDMILLLFTCSDYMLRQVLARKLFMCRLAIPFIIPTAEDKVEMMLWPLRSIILEWRNSEESTEEALVKCKINMVGFIRCGETEFSKSGLINDVLAPFSNATFFHKESPCGNEKRVISNGTVEMSHYLPGGSQHDIFNDPALFFNLRGDACDYRVQHSVLLGLTTVLVVVVDLGELRNTSVHDMLERTIKQKQHKVLIVLTDSKRHNGRDIKDLQELFNGIVAGCDRSKDVVYTFSTKGKSPNKSSIIDKVRQAIDAKMLKEPQMSLKKFAFSHSVPHCDVDENSNQNCRKGKAQGKQIMQEIKEVPFLQRKQMLLPKQGPLLATLGKLMRKLYRSSALDDRSEACTKVDEHKHKDKLKNEMHQIRMDQSKTGVKKQFIDQVIKLFEQPKEIREFAIHFLQLELDSISQIHLSVLQREKNESWAKLARERDDNAESAQCLERKIESLEENISEATFGWEHLMREVVQVYEVSLALKNPKGDFSILPDLVGRQLLEGHPVELMDGDHGVLPLAWVKAVLQSLSQLVGKRNRINVVSVVGVQSSGKSTLLNTMFGLEFAVSAGRCTRGIYAQLLPIKENQNLPFDYLLVLDSEGLRSQQREKYQHDNELATLVIGLSDVALVNMKGENVAEMVDVLEIVVAAFFRMKVADSFNKRRCKVFHQNVEAVGAQRKLADDRQKLEDKLNKITKQASEAAGLADSITSFNEIIGFDSQKDVVYFPGLWHGVQPMATISPGYSLCAADMQQELLRHIQEEFTTSITILDFITRIEDMWKGVLSDDFIFNFRNTLAAKAYIEVERKFSMQTFRIEQELLHWLSTHCNVQIENCQSEENLRNCCRGLAQTVQSKVKELVDQTVHDLQDFFTNHPASEIVDQWKEEKVQSLRMFGQTQLIQTEHELENSEKRKLIELHNKHAFKQHVKDISGKAITLAERMRGKSLSKEEIQNQFDELWEDITAPIPIHTPVMKCSVKSVFEKILSKKFHEEAASKCFSEQIAKTPLASNEHRKIFTNQDINKDHVFLKHRASTKKRIVMSLQGHFPSKADYFEEASAKVNHIMTTVMLKVDSICREDVPFKNVHGREIINVLWDEVEKHNSLPIDETEFGMTTELKALLAVCITCCAIPKFERMNRRYEDQYGVEAKMKAHKNRMFVVFINDLQQVSAEVTASVDFCEALKAKIKEHVWDDVKRSIPASIHRHLGHIKSTLIITMLEEIANTGEFTSFLRYASNPIAYAKAWVHQYCKQCLFGEGNTFRKLVDHALMKIMSAIRSSVEVATQKVSGVEGDKQYGRWKEEFCNNIETTIPVHLSDLEMAKQCTVKKFAYFQERVESELKTLEEDIQIDFHQVTAESVTWLDITCEKIFQRLWGCDAHCPFCKEPCQDTCQGHGGDHRCIQHKPSGIIGIGTRNWVLSKKLYTDTCNWFVASGETFQCSDVERMCRKDAKCKERFWNILINITHKYRDYKKYLPGWDIAPDASGEAGKYWQWALCHFEKELMRHYPKRKLPIPESWRRVSKQEAINSLKDFR